MFTKVRACSRASAISFFLVALLKVLCMVADCLFSSKNILHKSIARDLFKRVCCCLLTSAVHVGLLLLCLSFAAASLSVFFLAVAGVSCSPWSVSFLVAGMRCTATPSAPKKPSNVASSLEVCIFCRAADALSRHSCSRGRCAA